MPGATFTAAYRALRGGVDGPGQRRRVRLRVEDPAPAAAAGRVDERRASKPRACRSRRRPRSAPRSGRPGPARRRSRAATAQVSGSRSTASTSMPARARAIASPPMPQHRSASRRTPSASKRCARHSATCVRVACSTPSGVKYIRCASAAPNFATARCRSRAWPSGRHQRRVARSRWRPQLSAGSRSSQQGLSRRRPVVGHAVPAAALGPALQEAAATNCTTAVTRPQLLAPGPGPVRPGARVAAEPAARRVQQATDVDTESRAVRPVAAVAGGAARQDPGRGGPDGRYPVPDSPRRSRGASLALRLTEC